MLAHVVAFTLSLLITLEPLRAQNGDDVGVDKNEAFSVPPKVRRQVDFWIKIFQRYGNAATVIHDPILVDVIIDVIDFDKLRQTHFQGRNIPRNERRAITQRYLERYQLAIERIQKTGRRALDYGAMEQRVLQVYSRRPDDLQHLMNQRITLRTQQGLANEFPRAAERAGPYIPYMEKIFKSRGLPTDLTRIVFVESMFNKNALSKVGASGVWQFMPDTARLFMTVNSYIDERQSPLKASFGAASLLENNFRMLGSWPLAITAYNHGAGGMQRAMRTVGSRNLDDIIENYESPSFGFASRNFYAEFLAARQVYYNLYVNNLFTKQKPARIDHIRLEQPLSVSQLLTLAPINEETLKKYNLCLLPKAFKEHRNRMLPKGFEIIVPLESADAMRAALKRTYYSQASSLRKNRR